MGTPSATLPPVPQGSVGDKETCSAPAACWLTTRRRGGGTGLLQRSSTSARVGCRRSEWSSGRTGPGAAAGHRRWRGCDRGTGRAQGSWGGRCRPTRWPCHRRWPRRGAANLRTGALERGGSGPIPIGEVGFPGDGLPEQLPHGVGALAVRVRPRVLGTEP